MRWCKMRWRRLRETLYVFFLFWIFSFAYGDVVDSDKSVLLQFKSSVPDPSGLLSGWSSVGGTSDHCSWFGVFCDSKSRVLALNITGGGGGGGHSSSKGNSEAFSCSKVFQFPFYGFGIRKSCSVGRGKLGGKLSPALGKLTELRVLSLPFNDFTGVIPDELWGLQKLEVLDLEGNSLSGTLPPKFEGLRRLRVLNLGSNKLVGEIPTSLSNSMGLQILNLAANELNGTIPQFLGKFTELKGMYLSLNRLGGSVPSELGNNCKNLEHLDLSANLLVDSIPRSLGHCSQLRSLLLFSNMLEDVIPPEFGRLQKLQVLDVSRNSLSGPIPSQLGSCVELAVLVLSNLDDPLTTVDKSNRDTSLGLSNPSYDDFNFYQGAIPDEIVNLPKLRILWAPRANLEGVMPSNWGACNSLEMVNLAQNLFIGEIPSAFRHCKNLHYLNLSSNRLIGELDVNLPVPCMTVFDASDNHLSGSIPIFNQSSICPRIPSLNSHPDELYDPSASYLSFFTSRIQNRSPLTSLEASGSFIVFHNFGKNNFTGYLPSLPIAPGRLGRQTVYAFLAGGNKLTGLFPGNVFEKCDGLSVMIANFSNNRISGQIPEKIDEMCRSLKLLDVSRNQISGTLPPTLGNLSSLVSLYLSWNQLQGQIPDHLGQLKGLRYLSLAGNNLTGSIPSSLGQLQSLEVLDLSSNSLSGDIPKGLVSLKNLTLLLLNNNRLSGQIPLGLANVASLAQFNVSFNNLSGPIPLNDDLIKCSSVLGNPLLQSCHLFSLSSSSSGRQGRNDVSQNYAASPLGSPVKRRNGFNSIEIASITSASAIVSVLLALVVLFLYTRKCAPKSRIRSAGRREVTVFTDIGVPLSYENVVRTTGCFNASNCIGNGGFGATYRAEISPGVLVAIKRLSVGRFQGVQQFHAEIKTLGRMRHQNLVTLIGYHASESEMFLIYNYLPGGNLEKFIQERSNRAVDWRILHKIALDVACALAYLHDQCVPRVLHRDVKPSNILLDNEFNACLSDFGLARLLGTSETHATTGVAGTFGYVAPEYAMTCRVSDKADVYSYGVVLMELISDKKVLDPSFSSYGNGFNIVAWARMLLPQGRAKEFFTAALWESGPHDNLVATLHLAVRCTDESLSHRPTMKQVVQRLKQLQPPP
uniref:non-specific serine/threonine protein kinase n=1 Tax=Nelumbo nucifera TaxID=4432 RepID=A0A822YU17_NELNU|nr:TPA_asm: hypothetical protein HUJ06_005691 [Nelumbo nucifera]